MAPAHRPRTAPRSPLEGVSPGRQTQRIKFAMHCIDNVMPPLGDVSDVPQKLLDVNMMLLLPGKERTRVEWEALYRGAGLSVTAMVPVPDAFNMFVIEGRRANAT